MAVRTIEVRERVMATNDKIAATIRADLTRNRVPTFNLVCPASWDLGETAKIVLFSVTEGEDKPVKYPKMFRESRYAVLTKTDLLPYVPFDPDRAEAYAREVNPDIRIFRTSAQTGEGMDRWFDFLREEVRRGRT